MSTSSPNTIKYDISEESKSTSYKTNSKIALLIRLPKILVNFQPDIRPFTTLQL